MLRMLSTSLTALMLCGAAPMVTTLSAKDTAMPTFTKITPVLLADDVDACVRFWNRLGIETTMTFPFGEETGFAALASGDVELMYQSFAMSSEQEPKAIERVDRAIVYLETSSLAEIEARLGEAEVVVPVRETGHGTRELYVRDPAGNLIVLPKSSKPKRGERPAEFIFELFKKQSFSLIIQKRTSC